MLLCACIRPAAWQRRLAGTALTFVSATGPHCLASVPTPVIGRRSVFRTLHERLADRHPEPRYAPKRLQGPMRGLSVHPHEGFRAPGQGLLKPRRTFTGPYPAPAGPPKSVYGPLAIALADPQSLSCPRAMQPCPAPQSSWALAQPRVRRKFVDRDTSWPSLATNVTSGAQKCSPWL